MSSAEYSLRNIAKDVSDIKGTLNLRDYFAGQVAASIALNWLAAGFENTEKIAKLSYETADALLVVRDQKPSG
ncbi:MAG: hypothetical protein OXG19_07690 [Chloroflexi bacterium]|nr:hypothetical protein [Chloroflexota bacterium]